MTKTRQAILNKIRYLKTHWKLYLRLRYPNAHQSVLDNYAEFVRAIQRESKVATPVLHEDGSGFEVFYLSSCGVSTQNLSSFLKNLPDDSYLEFCVCADDYGATEIRLEVYKDVPESDADYSNRLTCYVRDLEHQLYSIAFPVTRGDNEELNRYIEYLENRLRDV